MYAVPGLAQAALNLQKSPDLNARPDDVGSGRRGRAGEKVDQSDPDQHPIKMDTSGKAQKPRGVWAFRYRRTTE